jgi:hypothetical protein
MGKEIPRSFAKLRSGEQLNLKTRAFTNLASLTAAGLTPAKNPGAMIYLSTGGTGSVPCVERWHELETGCHWSKCDLAIAVEG